MIEFICWDPKDTIIANDRQEALNMIRNNKFKKYKNVVVRLSDGDFNLESYRAKEFFGIKKD